MLLVCFVIYTEQAAISSSLLDEPYSLHKRRIDAHARASLPLFRGSNLGIFVRKRPSALSPDHPVVRRKETRGLLDNDDNDSAEFFYNSEHLQRRFDDYSENPGPMFGR